MENDSPPRRTISDTFLKNTLDLPHLHAKTLPKTDRLISNFPDPFFKERMVESI